MTTHAATQTGQDGSRRSALVAPPGPAYRAAPPEVPGVGERRWEAFAVARSPVHILSEQGLILEANAAFEELFGAPRRRFIGRHQAVLNIASVAANLRLWQ